MIEEDRNLRTGRSAREEKEGKIKIKNKKGASSPTINKVTRYKILHIFMLNGL
jgi:hypothetical protein